MSEVDFLTDYARPGCTVLYVGAAPGVKTPYLSGLFNNFKMHFHLWDPSPFDLSRTQDVPQEALDRITVFNDFFTDEVAKTYAGRDDILFISDIRIRRENEVVPSVDTVETDMNWQQEWIKIIKPKAFMVKFRLRYINDPSKFTTYEYLDGRAHIQAWAPQNSTETRLIGELGPDGIFPTKQWDPLVYESQMNYINTICREWGAFEHGVPYNLVPGLDSCYDCALEVTMWRKYLTSIGKDPNDNEAVAELMNVLTTYCTRRLTKPPHGIDPEIPLIKKRERIAHHAELRGVYYSYVF